MVEPASCCAVEDLTRGLRRARSCWTGFASSLDAGSRCALLGRNGTGKTTLIDSLVGVTRRHAGAHRADGPDITATARRTSARRAGIGWVPQERNIFKSLTVEENLTAVARPGAVDAARVLRAVPAARRSGAPTSARSCRAASSRCWPSAARWCSIRGLLLLDEPLEGLAPLIAEQVLAVVRRLIRDEGMSAIVVEQHAQKILGITDYAIILEHGEIVFEASAQALLAQPEVLDAHLGVRSR